MEKDDEVKGSGNTYTTELRQYDPRIGRWLSLDPLMHQFPWMSPYVAFDNNPVFFVDPFGLASEGEPEKTKPGEPINRTGNDPNSDSEKQYRKESVQTSIREVGEEKISFIYKDIEGGTGKRGDVTFSYKYTREENRATEIWKHDNQSVAYSNSISQEFKMYVPETKEESLSNEINPTSQAGNINNPTSPVRLAGRGGRPRPPPPPPREPRIIPITINANLE